MGHNCESQCPGTQGQPGLHSEAPFRQQQQQEELAKGSPSQTGVQRKPLLSYQMASSLQVASKRKLPERLSPSQNL